MSSQFERAVAQLDILCDTTEKAVGTSRPTKAQMVALINVARKVVSEFYGRTAQQ